MNKKLFYVPGLLSLVLLFPLCYHALLSQGAFKKETIIEIVYWNPEVKFYNSYYGDDPYKPQPKRNYYSFNLTGNEEVDKRTLITAQNKIRNLHLSNDTLNGVHFHFHKSAKYWVYIKVLDIFLQENVKIFLPFRNDIWVYNLSMPKQPPL